MSESVARSFTSTMKGWLRRSARVLTPGRDEPPGAPDIDRRIAFPLWRACGMVGLGAIPVLALAGVLGPSMEHREVAGERVIVAALFPEKSHVDQPQRLEVRVQNLTDAPADLRVSIDHGWLKAFDHLQPAPPFERAWVMVLADVPPGAERMATLELAAERPGRHRGVLRVEGPGEAVELPLHTTVFP